MQSTLIAVSKALESLPLPGRDADAVPGGPAEGTDLFAIKSGVTSSDIWLSNQFGRSRGWGKELENVQMIQNCCTGQGLGIRRHHSRDLVRTRTFG